MIPLPDKEQPDIKKKPDKKDTNDNKKLDKISKNQDKPEKKSKWT